MLTYPIFHFLICLLSPKNLRHGYSHNRLTSPSGARQLSESRAPESLLPRGLQGVGFGRGRHQMLPLPGRMYFNEFYFKSYLQHHSPGSQRLHCHLRAGRQMRNGRVRKWRIIKHTEKWALEQDSQSTV